MSTISGVATLYIGGIYEEVLTDPNHAYISYYSFGGKLVGMRRANQGTGGNDGQYRIVGDHLGSTSLVVDASTSPQVVSRQYYKPYGAVAWATGSDGALSDDLVSLPPGSASPQCCAG